ncbi:glycosyltransferase [Polaribacter sp.]|nr:glycosyltransferase [Polaribacter sp.]
MDKLVLLIPHYDNPKGLLVSLASIGCNENLDVLIVDDGSKNKFDEIEVKKAFQATGKIFFIYLQQNSGIEIALNKGLEYIIKNKYTYTARLDCGDICLGDRFQLQKYFLEEAPSISLVGSNVNFVDTNGAYLYTVKVPEKDEFIRKKMYVNAMHIHPSIMFRNSIFPKINLYPTAYQAAEDYAFFFNVMNSFKVANINKVLVQCEINPKGISTLMRKKQAKNRIKIILNNFYFGLYPIYGLLRSLLLYITPLSILIKIKKIVKN